MHSKDKLAGELEKAGLKDMAEKAREGYYHDFLSPLEAPAIQLAYDLRGAMETVNKAGLVHRVVLINSILDRHMEGEFDATLAESDEWAEGPEGRAAFERLAKGD